MAKSKNMPGKPSITLQEVEAVTRKLASDLAFCARRPVNIQLVGGAHIAYTYDTDKTKRTVQIVMNPNILTKVRNKERALQIWRGIGFHELAHHLWPADAQYKIAHKEGFRDLFNLIDDEQNERRGRSFDASWGACFQSVCAYIFPGKKQDPSKLNTGIVDGDKPAQAPKGRAADRTYGERWNRFAYHLRRHIPDCPDALVAEALSLIPRRFMDLTKDELLELTRQIHETLARGVVNPSDLTGEAMNEPQPEDEDDKNEEPEQDPPAEEPKPEPQPEEAPVEKDSWSWKKVFRSKWLYLPLGAFVMIWFAILMQGGVNFWVKVVINGLLILGAITAFLFVRRAYIKSLLARAKAAVTGGAASAKAAGASAGETVKTVIKATVAGAVVLGAAGAALYYLPLGMAVLAIGGTSTIGTGWYIMRRYREAKEKQENIGPLAITLIVLSSLASTAMLVWGLDQLGLSRLWLTLGASLVSMLFFFGWLLLLKDQRPRNKNWKPGKLARAKAAIARAADNLWCRFKKPAGAVLGFVWTRIIAAFFIAAGTLIAYICRRSWKFCKDVFTRLRVKLRGPLRKAWRNPFVRVAIIALPIATLLVMLYAVLTKAGSYGWWVALILALLLLALAILAWIFRKQIKKFIVTEMFMPMPQLMDAGMQPPLDMLTEWFNQVDNVIPVQADQEFWKSLLPRIYPLAQQLRPLLAKCGRASIDREDQPDGYDLIDEAELLLVGETLVFIDDDSQPKASVHLEVALDCSGSMLSPTVSLKPGEKFLLGKFFALVLEQAVINLPGVSARFWGFTDDKIYDCGKPGEGRISGLQCGGGNNDSAMLWHMGQSAAASGKDVKILLMLSDGQPSECSWLSLKNLVLQFEQEGMIPWNFALDVIKTPAFERFFTDLVGQTIDQAIVTMGETLAALAADGI